MGLIKEERQGKKWKKLEEKGILIAVIHVLNVINQVLNESSIEFIVVLDLLC